VSGTEKRLSCINIPEIGSRHEWHSVKPNTLGLKVLRTKTPAHRPIINNMISISLDRKPCVSEAYSVFLTLTYINILLIRVDRKSLIHKTLILIRVPFVPDTLSAPVPDTLSAPRKKSCDGAIKVTPLPP